MAHNLGVLGHHHRCASFDALLWVARDDFGIGIDQSFAEDANVQGAVGVERVNQLIDGGALWHGIAGRGCWRRFVIARLRRKGLTHEQAARKHAGHF